jgi:hypothetical protein
MNKSKLLLTSALVGSVAFAGASFAETKVIGNIETTITGSSEDGQGSTQGIGSETNIGLSTSKDLDNGMSMTAGFLLENGASDTEYLTVGTDAFRLDIANDYGNNLSQTAIPHISDQAGTIIGLANATTTYDNIEVANAHNAHHVAINANAVGGTFTARYTPDVANTRSGASSNTDAGASATEIMYKGSFGVDGLSVVAGKGEEEAATSAGAKDGEHTKIGLAYNFGQFAVGVEQQDSETAAATASQVETETKKAGVTFAANDNLSLGVVMLETEKKSGGTKSANDEEVTMLQLGYNFGGLGIEVSYADVENAGNTANTDVETFQIRTITKF